MRRWRHAHPTTHVTSPMATAQLRGSKHQKGTMPATGDGGVARRGGCGVPVDDSMARQRGSQPAASGISSTVAPLSAISCNKLRGSKQPSESNNWRRGRMAGSIGAAFLLRRVPA
eukprot:scaffold89090_cov68-Phaeocystis_antarctica.AAC.4